MAKSTGKLRKLLKQIYSDTADIREEILEESAYENSTRIRRLFDDMLLTEIDAIVNFLWKNYKIWLSVDKTTLDWDRVYWHKDGKNIDYRLRQIFMVYAMDNDLGSMWNKLEAIENTEIVNLLNEMIIGISAIEEWVMIYATDYSEHCDECIEHEGKAVDPANLDAPPFHTNCQCTFELRDESVRVDEISWEDLEW